MEPLISPAKEWLNKRGLSVKWLAERLTREGVTVKAAYLSQIIIGYRAPGRAIATAIARICDGVSVDALYRFKEEVDARREPAGGAAA